MVDQALRARTQRLLNGDIRADDLSRLFLYARDRCDGRESVKEIGDFVAHHGDRIKGPITKTSRDWFVLARTLIRVHNNAVDWRRLPPDFLDFLRASFGRLTDEHFKAKANISRAQASKIFPYAISRFVKNDDGTFALPDRSLSPQETAVLTVVVQTLVVKPAFDSRRLHIDFAATLKSHGLLQKAELRRFSDIISVVSLFAVSVMHNCKIIMTDGSNITLKSGCVHGEKIDVFAPVPADQSLGVKQPLSVNSAIFTTDCDAVELCAPDLWKAEWDFDVELTPEGKLARLG